MEWNNTNIGSIPNIEDVKIYSEKYKEKNPDYANLKNWYSSTIDSVPLHIGRIICQRSNLWWNVSLRKKYIKIIVIFSFIFSICIVLFGLFSNPSFKDFVLNIATPLLPIFIFCIVQYRENEESIENLENLKQELNSLWKEIIDNQGGINTDNISRKIQDEIYKNRRDNQLIFDWFYKKHRNKDEDTMSYSVDRMIDEYNSSVSAW